MKSLIAQNLIILLVAMLGAGAINAFGPKHGVFAVASHQIVVASSTPMASAPVDAVPPPAAPPEIIKEDADRIFNNRNRFMWLCFGGVGGSWSYFAYNLVKYRSFAATITKLTTTCYLTVSFITTIFATPYVMLYYKLPLHEEACGFGGWAGAMLAWLVIEISTAVLKHARKVAEKRGWIGLKDMANGDT